MKRFLITTALEETWRDDEPVLFLGEWCRRYSRKHRWEKMVGKVLPYHWDDRMKLYSDYRYLQDFYERLLLNLANQLNQIHGVDHGARYWRILIGPWLGYFVQMLFDRWASIQQACKDFDLTETIVLSGNENAFVPNDMSCFIQLFVGDEWNHHIYAAILKRYTSLHCIDRLHPNAEPMLDSTSERNCNHWVSRALVHSYSWAGRLLRRDSDALFLSTYLPVFDEIRLLFRLRQVPTRWTFVRPIRVIVNRSRRQWVLLGESRSDFEVFARELIPRQMPTIYLEGYKALVQQVADLPWPKKSRLIWTSASSVADDVFKAWTAEKVESGTPLVIGQHGGHYGIGRWSFLEDHEIAISDLFLSWGWWDTNRSKVKAVGQLKAVRRVINRRGTEGRALLVTCAIPRFSYWLYSIVVARQYLDYLEDQWSFVGALPNEIREQLIVRLFPGDFGWNQATRWRDRFPELHLDEGRTKLCKLVRRARICISTYNATTYLESLSMDVPTVIYWNPKHWELRESAIPYFDDLKRVGVFHETPESAAKHVAAIWHEVGKWWFDFAVRDVLERFKRSYCHRPHDLLDRVENCLRERIVPPEATSN